MTPTAAKHGPPPPTPFWPWAVFLLAAVWTVLIRVPLVRNAADHLDSDLAVDGLTLLDAIRGHLRWHYPGTPFTGIGGVALSLPQALIGGVGPETLVSGGTVAALGLLLATFLLAWRAFGPGAAAWSLAPLTFASNGAVWLSGRITGGHLLAAVWHAGAFALLADCLARGGRVRAAALGFWCGLGLYLDSMFSVTLAGLLPVAAGCWLLGGASRRGVGTAVVAGLAFLAGAWPRPVGAWLEPYDAYREQFAVVREPELLAAHARLLTLECLPRLLAGHRLPDLATEPDPASLSGRSPRRRRVDLDPVGAAVVGLTALVGLASLTGLATALGRAGPGRAVTLGLLVSAAATLGGFVVNRNIFNADNYRYLVCLLVPWSVGFGRAADALARRGRGGALAVAGFTVLLAACLTVDLQRWYARFGWVDEAGRPVRVERDDPVLGWLDAHPEVTWVTGGYWDVYRLAFLTGGRVRGAPFKVYPNRFPEWVPGAGEEQAVIVRPTAEGGYFRADTLRAGGREIDRLRGAVILAPAPGGGSAP